MFVSLNTNYWPFVSQVIADAKVNFLKNHDVDFLLWTDIPQHGSKEAETTLSLAPPQGQIAKMVADDIVTNFNKEFTVLNNGGTINSQSLYSHINNAFNASQKLVSKEQLEETIKYISENVPKENIFYTEPTGWPYPTLMRYHLFLTQEEKLKEYDYIYYLDADMRIVDVVGDEIICDGLTMAEHPMYSIRKEYIPPYEPNKDSAAYIPRFGAVVDEGGKKRLKPLYAAGGFQGGKTEVFIEAMKTMKANIDKDLDKNYISIWNDESHWNKYLFDYKGAFVALSPSYIYPDSLINEYYVKLWGCNYKPIIVTLTKKFSTSAEGGEDLRKKLATM